MTLLPSLVAYSINKPTSQNVSDNSLILAIQIWLSALVQLETMLSKLLQNHRMQRNENKSTQKNHLSLTCDSPLHSLRTLATYPWCNDKIHQTRLIYLNLTAPFLSLATYAQYFVWLTITPTNSSQLALVMSLFFLCIRHLPPIVSTHFKNGLLYSNLFLSFGCHVCHCLIHMTQSFFIEELFFFYLSELLGSTSQCSVIDKSVKLKIQQTLRLLTSIEST